eukprot:m.123931 g.123931  ORF g.123931 m.123931 type:complete len:496 (-) comp16271_c0_seq1:959-2446(-)
MAAAAASVLRMLLLLVVLIAATTQTAQASHGEADKPPRERHKVEGNYAFASIFSEQMPFSRERFLALRVLVESLAPHKFPFLVLASRGLSDYAKDTLEEQGATVVVVDDLAQGWVSDNQFNVLYLWNTTEYDKIIFLEIGNVVVHQEDLFELFMCGDFCAIYSSTPCAFNSHLFVLKPDNATFHRLMKNLDGPDLWQPSPSLTHVQRYLSQMFEACTEAPIFNPGRLSTVAKLNRVAFSYNIPSFYFIEKKNWDLLRCGDFVHLEDPMATIYYGAPLPHFMMPWYWWSTWLEPPWWFMRARSRLNEPETVVIVLTRVIACLFIGLYLGGKLVAAVWRINSRHTVPHRYITSLAVRSGPMFFSGLLTIVMVTVCAFLARHSFYGTVPPVVGWPLFIMFYHMYLIFLARMAASVVLNIRGIHLISAVQLSDLVLSLASWSLLACQPIVDEAMSHHVRWNVVSKVFMDLPTIMLLLGSQYLLFFKLVTKSSLFQLTAA